MNRTNSEKLFEQSQKYIPGGVNSPVRAFKSVGGKPIYIKSAKGAYLYDEDGNQYIDYINSWGPMICGHAWQPGIEAVTAQMKNSFSFGAPTSLELTMAELITQMVPNADKVRMVNSGTEACMSAIRLARGYTGKSKIIKFSGCYHGHADSFLIKAGSGALTLGTPNSPGVTPGTASDTLIARYNDKSSVETLVNANKDEIAAIIIEPVAGNMGCIPPINGFLEFLREICNQNQIVLIFDEVMTGFRVAKGGVQELYGVNADLICLGKVIGGGMPVGAYAGKAEIMDCIAPVGPVYQAGTLSGNPLAMSSGIALLSHLNENPAIYETLEKNGKLLESGMHSIMEKTDIPYVINRVGSMISIHFSENPIIDFESATAAKNELFNSLFHYMLNKGIYLPPSAYESWFMSTSISSKEISQTLEVLDGWVQQLQN